MLIRENFVLSLNGDWHNYIKLNKVYWVKHKQRGIKNGYAFLVFQLVIILSLTGVIEIS